LLKTKLNEKNLTVKDLKGIIEVKTSKNTELGVKFNENKNNLEEKSKRIKSLEKEVPYL